MNETDLEISNFSWRKLSFLWVSFLTTHRCWETEQFKYFRVIKLDLENESFLPAYYEINTDNMYVTIVMSPESKTSFNSKTHIISAWCNRVKKKQRAEASIKSDAASS